jgi:hypothetical protein
MAVDVPVDFEELRLLLQALGNEFTDAELRSELRLVDLDNSGELDFDEFLDMMTIWQQHDMQDVFVRFNRTSRGSAASYLES